MKQRNRQTDQDACKLHKHGINLGDRLAFLHPANGLARFIREGTANGGWYHDFEAKTPVAA